MIPALRSDARRVFARGSRSIKHCHSFAFGCAPLSFHHRSYRGFIACFHEIPFASLLTRPDEDANRSLSCY
jgi:hypothetical protein